MQQRVESKDFVDLQSSTIPPQEADTIRVVAVSDTHSRQRKIKADRIPGGDILIHAGDMTLVGKCNALRSFREWIGKQPHRHKIVIAGNHDLSLDKDYRSRIMPAIRQDRREACRKQVEDVQEFTYLEDEAITVEGYNIYGSPVQPYFHNWAFQKVRFWFLVVKS